MEAVHVLEEAVRKVDNGDGVDVPDRVDDTVVEELSQLPDEA